MLLTKDKITELKHEGNGAIAKIIYGQKDSSKVLFVLENLGYLPKNFDGESFLYPLHNKNSEVRYWSVKNLGKLRNENYLTSLIEVAKNDSDTKVRREAVSSIGRMHSLKAKHFLVETLKDSDPKIVCQAIRALLVFKNDREVDASLKPLVNHPNEMVRTVIYKEYFATERKTILKQHHAESYDYLKNVCCFITISNFTLLDSFQIVLVNVPINKFFSLLSVHHQIFCCCIRFVCKWFSVL